MSHHGLALNAPKIYFLFLCKLISQQIISHDHLTTKQQETINAFNQINDDPENTPSSKYYTPDEFNKTVTFSSKDFLGGAPTSI